MATDLNNGLTAQEAKWVACAGVAAFCAPSQKDNLGLDAELKIVKTEEDVGLEVVAITLPAETSKDAQEFFNAETDWKSSAQNSVRDNGKVELSDEARESGMSTGTRLEAPKAESEDNVDLASDDGLFSDEESSGVDNE